MSFYKSGTSPNKSYLHGVIRVVSKIFKETAHLKKSSTIYGGSLKILLITVTHTASLHFTKFLFRSLEFSHNALFLNCLIEVASIELK